MADELVSIIVPVHNAAPFLDECFRSILGQSYSGPMEVSVCDDASTDGSAALLEQWGHRFVAAGHGWAHCQSALHEAASPASAPGSCAASTVVPAARGAGCARNLAVRQSTGTFLCLLDADDLMLPRRVEAQLDAARQWPCAIVGSRFRRMPADATERYARWANGLTNSELLLQQYREITLIQPTWFMARATFEAVGGYVETAADAEALGYEGMVARAPATVAALCGSAARSDSSIGSTGVCSGGGSSMAVAIAVPCAAGAGAGAGASASGDNAAAPAAPAAAAAAAADATATVQERRLAKKAAKRRQREMGRQRLETLRTKKHSPSPKGQAQQNLGASQPAICEDLIFFHQHLDLARRSDERALHKVDEELVIYRHHSPQHTSQGMVVPKNLCFVTPRKLIMRVRARALERRVLARPPWNAGFTVWGAGRDGRALVNELQPQFRALIRAFCDIDPKKVGQEYHNGATGLRCPIQHFSEARAPVVCCVALDRTAGAFETNLSSLGLTEGVDYWQFC